MSVRLFALLALLAAASAPAQEIPPPPPPLEEGEVPPADPELGPEVVIIERGEDVIEEYRTTGGRIYMVKITPAGGVPYYLIDTDGDGSLETHQNELDPAQIVQWRLFQW